jgi:hypothetical protein
MVLKSRGSTLVSIDDVCCFCFCWPQCFAFVGYIVGLWAPGEVLRLNKAGTVLCNLLRAHCAAYRWVIADHQAVRYLVHIQAQSGLLVQDAAYRSRVCVWGGCYQVVWWV